MSETRRRFLKLAASGIVLPAVAETQSPAARRIDGRGQGLRVRQSGEAVLACGGDWFLTRSLSTSATAETGAVFDIFRQSDAGFANLENGLSTVGSGDLGAFRQGNPLRGDPALASELGWGGVRNVSLANNHTGNFGREALLQTIATLDAVKVTHAGAGPNIERAFAPTYLKAADLTIAFLSAYSLYHNFAANDQATATDAGVAVCRAYDVVVQPQVGFDSSNFATAPYLVDLQNPCSQTIIAALRGDVDRLKAAVKEASSRADFTLLSVHTHWGRHGKHDLPPNFRPFAQEMIDAGVDLFLGHGPHAIRGIELYRGKPIVYSMGNLVLQPPSAPVLPQDLIAPTHEGLIVRATVARRSVRALELLPVAIDAKGDPRFPTDDRAGQILAKLGGLSAPFGTEIASRGWFGSLVTT